jgi:CubicO group peptidase (beta-lactamase class C family)
MQLAAARAIDLDQPLAAYLPELAIRTRFTGAPPIRVRDVLCHHGGLPTDLAKGMWSGERFTRVTTALAEEYVAFPPRLVLSYSNVGYSLLGHLVERVSGMPFEGYVAERLTAPLGMAATRLTSAPPAGPHAAHGHREGERIEALPIRDLPAQGLITCTDDLGRLLCALLNGGQLDGHQVLTPATLETMFEAQNADNPFDLGHFSGLGWFLEQGSIPGCGRVVRHGGTTLGYAAELILLPEDDLGIAVLANADGARGVLTLLAEEVLARMLEQRPAPAPAELFLGALERAWADARAEDIAGDYATDLGMIAFHPEAGTLCACMLGETVPISRRPGGWYAVARDGQALPAALESLAGLELQTRRVDGREVVVARRDGRETLLGERVKPLDPEGPWPQRAGRYEVLNADPGFPVEDLAIRRRDGHLCLTYRMPRLSAARIQVPLGPLSETEAVILGLGRTRGETVRVVAGPEGEQLRWSGLIARRVGEAPAADQV